MEKNKFITKLAPLFVVFSFMFGFSLLNDGQLNRVSSDEKNVKITFLDVGQGDSILISTPDEKNILIDGGHNKSVLTSLGKELQPTDKELESVVLTHPHQDHLAGLNYVLENYQVNNVYLTGAEHTSNDYLEFLKLINEKQINSHRLIAGGEIKTNTITIRSLWPPKDLTYNDLNQTSLVLLLSYKENDLLLMGDLPEK